MNLTANERLLDAAIHRAIDLHQYSEGVVRRMIGMLNRADAELIAALTKALESLPAESFTVARLEALIQSARLINASAYSAVGSDLARDIRALAQLEASYQFGLFNSTIPAEILQRFPVAAISVEQVYAAALSRPFQGRLLSEWTASVADDRMRRIREAVRVGYVSNETTADIVRRIRGTRAMRYGDGIIEADRRSLTTVVRTALSHTASTARSEFYGKNLDLIKAERWTSTLDTRTTPICMARDHKDYHPVTHKPIGHTLPWLGGPGRAHWGCRSTSVPITKSWKELGGSDLPEFSASTRASMDGQVPGDVTYRDWLQKQSAARQDEVLGATRGAAMRAGKLPWDAMFNSRGMLITLEELRKRGVAI